ncbi:TniB family NTP-binding protein [Streptomyces sp. P9-A2]|uniref:TniB family NTP-binding protein n=1 Tax=Streptomyces sp. P9-A2 TaxID=3072284 RepID=UPI002FC718E7
MSGVDNGKSMIVEKFRRTHRPVSHPDREETPVLAVQMPSDPSAQALADRHCGDDRGR